MSQLQSSNLFAEDLNAFTLPNYLKDSTFVEYFNSFLLLPAFSNRLFFNQDTGYFEEVHNDGEVLWDGDITPSTSLATLYLPDQSMGESLNREQSWMWVIEHRLPLFLRSDLYSEYKMCKLLTTPPLETPTISACKEGVFHSEADHNLKRLDRTFTGTNILSLPDIPFRGGSGAEGVTETSSATNVNMNLSVVPKSKSDAILESRHRRTGRLPRSLSVNQGLLLSSSDRTSASGRKFVTANYLATKSGMSAFWKFLKGKAGERNLLFWLDAERIHYYESSEDQRRLIKDLRERYFNSGSPLELPAESKMRVRLSKTSQLTMDQLGELQNAMITRLRNYWCPRFLVHCLKEDTVVSKVPRMFRSGSAAPHVAPKGHIETGYRDVVVSSTPTHTPTYRRMVTPRPRSFIALRPRSTAKKTGVRRVETVDSIWSDQRSGFVIIPSVEALQTASAPPHVDHSTNLQLKQASRRVWGKATPHDSSERVSPTPQALESPITTQADGSPVNRASVQIRIDTASSVTRQSQLAKYTAHHLPHPSSTCASGMERTGSSEGMCVCACMITSVSGTPVHAAADAPLEARAAIPASKSTYDSLLHCLASENRKAGGYFLQYLSDMKTTVYLNCLKFWREVQEYKALFVRVSFSPCSVEMKAKALYGRYICKSSTENIECSAEVEKNVSHSLWPSYEDLFDEAEEHALDMLLSQWNDLCTSEDLAFQRMDTIKTPKSPELFEDDSFGSLSPSPGCHSLLHPERDDQAITLEMILENDVELEHFKMFLNKHCAAEDLMCWLDIETFRGIPVSDKYFRNLKAKQIRKGYFNKSYFFGPKSPASKEAQRQVVMSGGLCYGARLPARPMSPVLREAQKHVRARLEKVWLKKFISSPEFLERNRGTILAKATSLIKAPIIAYEHTFINSHQAIVFRKFLQSRMKMDDLFLKYLKIKALGDTLGLGIKYPKADLAFWYEVQKYKRMFHAHTNSALLEAKMVAIFDCFFKSSVPPPLQIDVPVSLAEQAMEKPMGPYVFRETQGVVFKTLYSGFKEYRSFAHNLTSSELNQALTQLESDILEMRRAKKEQEEKQKQEEERRRAMMPHFETPLEKEQRLKKEKEQEEFGPSAVQFTLSSPDPSYVYYTELPRSRPKVSKQKKALDAKRAKKFPRRRAIQMSTSEAEHLLGEIAPDWFKDATTELPKEPVVAMKLKGHHTPEQNYKLTVPPSIKPEECRCSRGESPYSDITSLKEPHSKPTKLTSPHLTKSPSKLIRDKRGHYKKVKEEPYEIPPNSTLIKMQLSGIAGKPYAFGKGLPEEQNSYLSVTTSQVVL